MKDISLITISTEEAEVGDFEEYYHFIHHEVSGRVCNSSEHIRSVYTNLDNVRIQRVVDHGIKYYFAVSSRMWEYLYAMENPITAASQAQKINIQSLALEESYERISCLSGRVYKARSSTLWQRIKFVFTGVDI